MGERIQLPFRPSGTSLAAHIAALDLLAARLDGLSSRSRWPARIPINSKASFDGEIVHTNELKVNVGGDWWVEMSASEAAEYVRRRKAQLLDEQARLMEGQTSTTDPNAAQIALPAGAHPLKASELRFDPLFAHPVRSGSSKQPVAASSPAAEKPTGVAAPAAPPSASVANAERTPVDTKGHSVTQAPQKELPENLKKLMELLGGDLGDKMAIPRTEGGADGTTLNDDGLPIHEIRETPEGVTLGASPEETGGEELVHEDKDEDYWSEEAAARREDLRRRIFNDDDSEDEDEENNEAMDVDEPAPAAREAAAAPPAEAAPSAATLAPVTEPTTPTLPSPNVDVSPSVSPMVPKSILKTSGPKKKSVSFDASVPIPPDSPPVEQMKRLSFPHPIALAAEEDDSRGKSIPILNQPTPGRKSQPDSFAGFKRGFLSGPGSSPAPVPQIVNLAPDVDDDVQMAEPKKKQSLFAQRRSEGSGSPALPKLSDAKRMAAMKTSIVEKPPLERRPTPIPNSLLPPAVKAAVPSVSPVDSSPAPSGSPAPEVNAPEAQTPVIVVDDDEDDSDDYGDLGDFSDDEEDEYNLDEALLAREVALEYHRRQAWQRPMDEDDFDPDAPGSQVLMGVPRVSTITGGESPDDTPLRIVNPTADDLSQFLRVGRADDGELVFEQPMVDDQSDSEGEDDEEVSGDRRERRQRRQDVMERLLRGDYEDQPSAGDQAAVDRHHQQAWQASLPPSVGPVVEEVTPEAPASAPPKVATTRDVVERTAPSAASTSAPAPPMKVSRFKAARQSGMDE